MLQIAGTKDRPDPGTHLGAIAVLPGVPYRLRPRPERARQRLRRSGPA